MAYARNLLKESSLHDKSDNALPAVSIRLVLGLGTDYWWWVSVC